MVWTGTTRRIAHDDAARRAVRRSRLGRRIDRIWLALHISRVGPRRGVVALYVLVAIWSLVPGWTRQLSLGIGMFTAFTGWLLFQGLGDLTSGQATDPNTGPLIVLLATGRGRCVLARDQPIERMIPSRRVVLWTDRFLFRAVQSRYLTLDTPLTLWVFYWQGTQNIRGISVVLNEDGVASIKSL